MVYSESLEVVVLFIEPLRVHQQKSSYSLFLIGNKGCCAWCTLTYGTSQNVAKLMQWYIVQVSFGSGFVCVFFVFFFF